MTAPPEAYGEMAAQQGWEFSDNIDANQLPLYLTARRLGYTGPVISGNWEGMQFMAFEYGFAPAPIEGGGGFDYSCATTYIPAQCPRLLIGRETLEDHLVRLIGIHDIQFDSRSFDWEFNVKSDDPAFAHLLLDEEMRRFLLSDQAEDFWFQTGGSFILCYSVPLPPARLGDLLDALKGFRERIPEAVVSQYGIQEPPNLPRFELLWEQPRS